MIGRNNPRVVCIVYQNFFFEIQDPNLKIASQLFIGQQYDIKSTYKNSVKKYLECCFETVDFMRSPKEAARRINSWVSEKTENEISDIVDPGKTYKLYLLISKNNLFKISKLFSTFLIYL